MTESPRLAVDIGGTFTDVALEQGHRLTTTKVLTTPHRPEDGVLAGLARVMDEAGADPGAVGLIIHGTTLATNALIERKGAKTALIVTEGLRDSLEMAYENRFAQYDISIDRPPPLVPRHLRWPVRERLNAAGEALIPLDDASVEALVPKIAAEGVESIAIGLIHAYANPAHERRVAEILATAAPEVSITLSSAVCPEIREYERQSTACANAYVRPLMARYLTGLEAALRAAGFTCPFLLMTSGGGLAGFETAVEFPIRLVESGPAGGAILAGRIAAECGLDSVLSFDMGGTTAKICLIDDGAPLTSRTFEVAREYRFMKGSGLPLRIPAIEMVEIGAGGGSIAALDTLGRIQVGPESAGAEPGPACYDQGGEAATVTDADVALGRIEPASFAGGSVGLAPARANEALERALRPMGLAGAEAAYAVAEVVDENMANAARVHAIEWGKDVAARTLIAFGGAAPLHAARLARKLGITRVIVPTGAGVGSAIGFLRAPVAYEVVRSRYQRLRDLDTHAINRTMAEMHAEARAIVEPAAPGQPLEEARAAYMRYIGQGHEISVALPIRPLEAADGARLQAAFDTAYTALYGRTIPNLDVEILSWTLGVRTTATPVTDAQPAPARATAPAPAGHRPAFDAECAAMVETAIHRRADLSPGMAIEGPALIVEDQTTTVVPTAFTAAVDARGYLVLTPPACQPALI